VKYRFMNEHRHDYSVTLMCRVLRVARAGFYAWLHAPVSDRDIEDARLLELIRHSHAGSHEIYGARRVFGDLREVGETCGLHRVERLMRRHKIRAVRGYRKPRTLAGRPSLLAPNRLQQAFTVDAPNKVWVTDITDIRTWQGWLYLAVVLDLYARKVVGWSMKPTLSRELALDALLMAVRRRKPDGRVLVHSDQGSQYGSDDFKRFCAAHSLETSMSRRGNCWDNAVAESFFSSLKKERIQNASTRPAPWRAPISSTISRRSTTEPAATAISAASVPRRSNALRLEARLCPRNRGPSNRRSLAPLTTLRALRRDMIASSRARKCCPPPSSRQASGR
jgi:putative transposase